MTTGSEFPTRRQLREMERARRAAETPEAPSEQFGLEEVPPAEAVTPAEGIEAESAHHHGSHAAPVPPDAPSSATEGDQAPEPASEPAWQQHSMEQPEPSQPEPSQPESSQPEPSKPWEAASSNSLFAEAIPDAPKINPATQEYEGAARAEPTPTFGLPVVPERQSQTPSSAFFEAEPMLGSEPISPAPAPTTAPAPTPAEPVVPGQQPSAPEFGDLTFGEPIESLAAAPAVEPLLPGLAEPEPQQSAPAGTLSESSFFGAFEATEPTEPENAFSSAPPETKKERKARLKAEKAAAKAEAREQKRHGRSGAVATAEQPSGVESGGVGAFLPDAAPFTPDAEPFSSGTSPLVPEAEPASAPEADSGPKFEEPISSIHLPARSQRREDAVDAFSSNSIDDSGVAAALSGVPTATHALVLPSATKRTGEVSLRSPLDETGELILTGALTLPSVIGETGRVLNSYEKDTLNSDEDQGQYSANVGAKPVSVKDAVTSLGEKRVIPVDRGSSRAVTIGLSLAAAVLMLAAAGLLIYSFLVR